MRTIVHEGDPVLRAVAHEVPAEDIATPDIQSVITDMKAALSREKFGVAIAAPQIGEPLRIFVIGGKVFAARNNEDYDEHVHADQVFINPEVITASKKIKIGDEGCLSVPYKYGTKVPRSEKMKIRYYDEFGASHERGASSFLARIFQHEIDHLNGILYTDVAHEVVEVDDELRPIANT